MSGVAKVRAAPAKQKATDGGRAGSVEVAIELEEAVTLVPWHAEVERLPMALTQAVEARPEREAGECVVDTAHAPLF